MMKTTDQQLQMEWLYNNEQQRQRDFRRQQKYNDLVAWRETDSATSTGKQNNPQNVPLTNHWFNSLSIPPPPGFQDTSKYTFILPRPTEPPKTPPSFKTASFRRRCMGSEPISPPNPLRLANTTTPQLLPRPETLPRFLRAPFSPLNCERIGDPSLKVFKVKLPDYLIDGPLDALIMAAEQYAKLLPSGWRTNLYSLTKCDIPCPNIPGIESYLNPIETYILLTMKMLYAHQKNASNIALAHSQPHIVKYSKELGHTGGKHLHLFGVSGFVIRVSNVSDFTEKWECGRRFLTIIACLFEIVLYLHVTNSRITLRPM